MLIHIHEQINILYHFMATRASDLSKMQNALSDMMQDIFTTQFNGRFEADPSVGCPGLRGSDAACVTTMKKSLKFDKIGEITNVFFEYFKKKEKVYGIMVTQDNRANQSIPLSLKHNMTGHLIAHIPTTNQWVDLGTSGTAGPNGPRGAHGISFHVTHVVSLSSNVAFKSLYRNILSITPWWQDSSPNHRLRIYIYKDCREGIFDCSSPSYLNCDLTGNSLDFGFSGDNPYHLLDDRSKENPSTIASQIEDTGVKTQVRSGMISYHFEKTAVNNQVNFEMEMELERQLYAHPGPSGNHGICVNAAKTDSTTKIDSRVGILVKETGEYHDYGTPPLSRQVSEIITQWIQQHDELQDYLSRETNGSFSLHQSLPKELVYIVQQYCHWFVRGIPGPRGENGLSCICSSIE
jgi:hypothetical protein